MSRKKERPKALFAVKGDFVESLDNFTQQSLMFLQAVEQAVSLGLVNEPALSIIKERMAAFRLAMSSGDEP
jgi:hypothetical protein